MTHPITPPTVSTMAELVALGNYDVQDNRIAKLIPFEPTEAKEIELVHFDKYISSEDAIAEMEKQGLRPATATELLLLGAQHPEVRRENPIVALGSSCELAGVRHVPYLYEFGNERGVGLGIWMRNRYGYWRFAAVRK